MSNRELRAEYRALTGSFLTKVLRHSGRAVVAGLVIYGALVAIPEPGENVTLWVWLGDFPYILTYFFSHPKTFLAFAGANVFFTAWGCHTAGMYLSAGYLPRYDPVIHPFSYRKAEAEHPASFRNAGRNAR